MRLSPSCTIAPRAEATRLGYQPATINLRLPLGFSALGPEHRKSMIERELSRAVRVAHDAVDADR